jgi:hypothetical protein
MPVSAPSDHVSLSWRYCVVRAVRSTVTISLVLVVVILLTHAKNSVPVPWAQVSRVILALLMLYTLFALAMNWYYGFSASAASLRLRSWAGRYVEIPWSAIETVTPTRMLGLELLRVQYAGAKRPAFLPLWFSDPTGFRATVVSYAGDRSALAVWLAQRSGRQRALH